MAGEIKILEFAEGTVTTQPTNLVPIGSGLVNVSITFADSPYTIIPNRRILTDASGGAIAATTPAIPADGDRFVFMDTTSSFGANNITITAAGGQTINGGATDVLEDDDQQQGYVYDIANTNWIKIVSGGGAGGLENDGVNRTALFTAEDQTEYNLDSTAGGYEIDAPVGAAGVRWAVIDAGGFLSTNSVTVVDNGLSTFNGGTPLELNFPTYVEFVWDVTDSVWLLKSPAAPDNIAEATSAELGVVKKNRYQRNDLSGDISSADSDNASLRFTGLTNDAFYRLDFKGKVRYSSGSTGACLVFISENGNEITRFESELSTNTVTTNHEISGSVTFQSTGTGNIVFNITNVTATIILQSGVNRTYATLTELENIEETSIW